MARVAILGTGMAAFGAWHRLRDEGHDVVLYDKNEYVGGHTASWTFEPGFTFDHGPHISFTKNERVRELLADNVGGAYEEIQYKVDNYWRGYWAPHPVQCHLHGLPQDLVTQVILDFVELGDVSPAEIGNYEDWLRLSYGRTFAEQFPEVYTRKYHTTDARNLTTDWIGPRMYRPSLEEVLRGALAPETANVHYVTGFRYPSRGGFVRYLEDWASQARIALGHEVVAVQPVAGALHFRNGSVEQYDALVSSVPLPDLVAMLPDVPADVRSAAELLACTGCVLVNLGVDRPSISEAHISYFYDPGIVFSRLGFPYLMSPNNAPQGMSSVQAEVYYSKKYLPLNGAPEDYIEPVVRNLVECGVLESPSEVVYRGAMLVEYANIIFDHDRAPALEKVHGYLDQLGIAWCGRYGEWGYLWTDEAFVSGERAGDAVAERLVGVAARAAVGS